MTITVSNQKFSIMGIETLTGIIGALVGALGLLYTWRKEKTLNTRDLAKQHRETLSQVVQGITKLQNLVLQPYFSMHPTFVDVDSNFVDTVKARDEIWRKFYTLKNENSEKISSQGLETDYMRIFSTFPTLVSQFKNRVNLIIELNDILFQLCNEEWQQNLLVWEGKETTAKPAEIGNLLRGTFGKYEAALKLSTSRIIQDLIGICDQVSNLKEKDIVNKRFHISYAENIPTVDDILMLFDIKSEQASNEAHCLDSLTYLYRHTYKKTRKSNAQTRYTQMLECLEPRFSFDLKILKEIEEARDKIIESSQVEAEPKKNK